VADTRYLVYVTEPNDHYASQSAAETAATALSEADHGSTYLVRGAVIETIATVSAVGVVTQTPVPNARWDSQHVGWHFDEAENVTRASVGTGTVLCDNDLVDVNTNVGVASGIFNNAAHLSDGGTDEILRADSLDYRFSGDFTWIGWVHKIAAWPAGTDVDIMSAVDDSASPDFGFFSTADATFFEFFDSSSGSVTVTKDMTDLATWYFMSVVYTASTRVARCALDAASFTNSSALGVGMRQLSTKFEIIAQSSADFYVDEHHFFTETKTDAEILEFFNNSSGRLYPYG
jgi:hypothetical protein